MATAKFLATRGALVTATDKRSEADIAGIDELKELGVKLELSGHEVSSFISAELIVLSPGVPPTIAPLAIAGAKGIEVVSDIELFYRFADVPIIAIAGTNGKSTTTVLLGEALKAAGNDVFVGGNLGRPALDYFSEYQGDKEADYAVLEISSYHLERVESFRPKVAVLLNITEDHLERYRDFADYAETKLRVFRRQESSDFAVINVGDQVIVEGLREASLKGEGLKGGVIAFSSEGALDEGLYLAVSDGLSHRREGEDFIVHMKDGDRKEYSLAAVALKGTHNAENIMAVMAVGEALGIDGELVIRVAKGFKGLSHRTEFVRELDGVSYVDDSKSTNAGSLYKALVGMKGPVVLIAGGRDKGGDYKFLRELVGAKVVLMIVIGESKERLKAVFGGVTKVASAASLEEAVDLARGAVAAGNEEVKGATVLFSPACSSFDMFKNFEERGERFKELVEAL